MVEKYKTSQEKRKKSDVTFVLFILHEIVCYTKLMRTKYSEKKRELLCVTSTSQNSLQNTMLKQRDRKQWKQREPNFFFRIYYRSPPFTFLPLPKNSGETRGRRDMGNEIL